MRSPDSLGHPRSIGRRDSCEVDAALSRLPSPRRVPAVVTGSVPRRHHDEFPAGGKHVEPNAATARRDSPRTCLPVLLTSTEVAELLRTTRKAVYAMVERRQVPGVIRLGRRVLFQQHTLLDWLRQKSTPSLER
jgi:excisionase family DNA binding protein